MAHIWMGDVVHNWAHSRNEKTSSLHTIQLATHTYFSGDDLIAWLKRPLILRLLIAQHQVRAYYKYLTDPMRRVEKEAQAQKITDMLASTK